MRVLLPHFIKDGEDDSLGFKGSLGAGRKRDGSDFECVLIGARLADLATSPVNC